MYKLESTSYLTELPMDILKASIQKNHAVKPNRQRQEINLKQSLRHTDWFTQWIRGTKPTIASGALRQTLKASSTEEHGNMISSSIEKTASNFKSLISLNLLFKLSSLFISNFSSICRPLIAFDCTTWFRNCLRDSEGALGSLHTICIESSPGHDV